MGYFELYSEVKDIYSNGSKTKRVIVPNLKGLVILDIEKIGSEEYLYIEMWKSFVDRLFGKENICNLFDIYFSCRVTNQTKRPVLDLIIKPVEPIDNFDTMFELVQNKVTFVSIVPLHKYVTKFYSNEVFEVLSFDFFSQELQSLPNFYSKELFKEQSMGSVYSTLYQTPYDNDGYKPNYGSL